MLLELVGGAKILEITNKLNWVGEFDEHIL